jgi:hypothetical protein
LDGKLVLDGGDHSGFVLVDSAGGTYTSRLGSISSICVEESGPLRATVHLTGDHRSESGQRLFRWELRAYAYAHLPWVEMEYTFVNDADPLHTELRRIGFDVRPRLASGIKGLCGAYRDLYESREPFTTYIAADKHSKLIRMGRFFTSQGAQIYDQSGRHVEREGAGEWARRVAHGWLDASDDRSGVAVALKWMVQLRPKEMEFTGDGIRVNLWPYRAGGLRWHQGMARTHRFLLLFHHGTGQEARVNEPCTCYDDDLLLWAPGWYVESGVFGPLFAHSPERYPHIEAALRDYAFLWQSSVRRQGFADYGDESKVWAAEEVMANNYIDTAHALALQYARVGERPYYEELESTAWHTMDVDVVHHTTMDPLELGGQRHTGAGHVQYDCEGVSNITVAPSQMWTEGLLEYYYLSGHLRALEIARGIGDCFLRMLDRGWGLPPYHVAWHGPRDSGWPLIALLALFAATGEQKWLDGSQRIVDALVTHQLDDGTWSQEMGWYRSAGAMQLGVTITALGAYHRSTGDERCRKSLVRAADGLLQLCTAAEGTLVFHSVPYRRWNYHSGVAFEGLGYVWELTGDTRYLRAGWLGHRSSLGAWPFRGPPSAGDMALSIAWRGNLRYMYWAEQAGLLRDLSP